MEHKGLIFAAYRRGSSAVSGAISWWSRSVYSHIALWFPDYGEVYEAVDAGWVQAPLLSTNHPGAKIDLLGYIDPMTPEQVEEARRICKKMVGAPYDYRMVFAGFVLRLNYEPKASRKQFFCDEGAILVAAEVGKPIVSDRVQAWKCTPDDVNKSAVLKWEGSVQL